MFDKICIKSNNGNEQKIDIAFLIDTMLFYGEVNVLVHENELVTLLNFFDIDVLAELIRLKRIKLHVRQNILGVSKVGNVGNYQYGIGFYRPQNEDVKSVLYRAHRKIINNSIQNNKFADRFYYIVSSFEHKSIEDKIINEDLNNTQYLKLAVLSYLQIYYPEYQQNMDLEFEIEKSISSHTPFDTYCVHSNLDTKLLTDILYKKGYKNPFDYSGLLLALGEARSDNYTAGLFESELVTDKSYSGIISLQLSDCVSRALKSQEEIKLFQDQITFNCPSLGEAYLSKVISTKELLYLLEEGDKFRSWLKERPVNSTLIHEYVEELTQKTKADNPLIKGVRWLTALVAGFTPGIGTVLSAGISAGDTFFGDKLLKGWKPNHFIHDKLIPALQK